MRIESGCETARSLDFSLYDSRAVCARVWFVGSSLITLKLVSVMLSFLFQPASARPQLEKRRTPKNLPHESEGLVAADSVGVAMLVCLAEISAIDFAVAQT